MSRVGFGIFSTVRHEVAEVIVSMTKPVVLLTEPNQGCIRGNLGVPSPDDTCNPPVKGDPKPTGSKGLPPVQVAKVLRLNGMVNASELLLNVVNVEEPNALTGSDQNGMWRGISPSIWEFADKTAIGEKAGPTPFIVTSTKHGKPESSPQIIGASRPQGRPTKVRAKDRGKKPMPSCNGTNTD